MINQLLCSEWRVKPSHPGMLRYLIARAYLYAYGLFRFEYEVWCLYIRLYKQYCMKI
jgi:hypothetical protein